MYITKHEVVADNIRGLTIRGVILKKCPFYYEFEALMGESPIVTPPYIEKSLRPGISESNPLIAHRETREETEDTENTHDDITN